MHFTGIHTDFLGAKVGACITSAYGKSDSKWPLKSVCRPEAWSICQLQDLLKNVSRIVKIVHSECMDVGVDNMY